MGIMSWLNIGATSGPASTGTQSQETRWRGASRSLRSLLRWNPSIGSAKSDLPDSEKRTLTARSRDAYRSQPIARAAITRSRTNIIGTGLMARPSVDALALGLSEEQANEANALLQSLYEMWAEDPNECDAEASQDIYGLQGLWQVSAMLSGDVFGLTPYELRDGGLFGLKVQVVEADRVCNPDGAADTPELCQGVALRSIGAPLGYWFCSAHPGDSLLATMVPTWEFRAAFGGVTGRRRVLHGWNEKDRPGQVRGAPYLAPILEPLKQLERYGSAELSAAVVSAMFTVFIERGAEQFDENGQPIGAFAGETTTGTNAATDPPTINLGEGAIVDLGPGEKANTANPARPNVNFDPFFMAVVKQIGAALELPVDELLLHYQSSYSAARAAMLQAWRFYLVRRARVIAEFCQPIYGLLLDELVASGRFNAPGYADPRLRRAWQSCLWIGPARGAMDELKEANAAKARIAAGISNETIETMAQTGESWDAVEARRAQEVRIKRANGTMIEAPATTKAPAMPDQADDQEDDQPDNNKDDANDGNL